MNRRTFLTTSAGLLAAPAIAAQKKETVRIVSSLPRRGGSVKEITDGIADSIRLAIADWEKQLPFEVKYHDLDDTAGEPYWDAGREADNAREALKDKEVVAFIGPYNSGAAKVSMPILNEAGLVQVSPSCTWPGLTKKVKGEAGGEPDIYRKSGKVTFCRVCPHDATQGPLTANFLVNQLKAKTVYILDDKELYGRMVADGFEAGCKRLGVKVLGRESLNIVARDYKALVGKVKEAKPDAVYFGGTTQRKGPQVAIDMHGEGLNCPLVVPDGCYEEAFIKAAGAEVFKTLTCYAMTGWCEPSLLGGAGAEFVRRYKEKYKKDPDGYAVYGYEAAAVVLEAVKQVGKKDREAIRKAVLATKDFDKGALPKWSFDADGDTTLQQVSVSKVEDGKFKPLKVLEGAGK